MNEFDRSRKHTTYLIVWDASDFMNKGLDETVQIHIFRLLFWYFYNSTAYDQLHGANQRNLRKY